MSKRSAILLAALTALSLLAAVTAWYSLPNRSVGKATLGVGTAGSAWSREVEYSVDGRGNIEFQRTTATITFSGAKLLIEKTRVLLDGRELVQLAEDAKRIEVDYTDGILTITADGAKVYDAKLRE